MVSQADTLDPDVDFIQGLGGHLVSWDLGVTIRSYFFTRASKRSIIASRSTDGLKVPSVYCYF